jgi:hypothetical protein
MVGQSSQFLPASVKQHAVASTAIRLYELLSASILLQLCCTDIYTPAASPVSLQQLLLLGASLPPRFADHPFPLNTYLQEQATLQEAAALQEEVAS